MQRRRDERRLDLLDLWGVFLQEPLHSAPGGGGFLPKANERGNLPRMTEERSRQAENIDPTGLVNAVLDGWR